MPDQANLVIDTEQLKRNLQALPGAVPDLIVQQGLVAAARVASKRAKQPGYAFNDRTGMARKSIRVATASRTVAKNFKKGPPKGHKTYFAALKIGKDGAKHGSLLELGTGDMKARAPLRKAVEETLSQAWRVAVKAMEKEFGKLEAGLKSGKIAKKYLTATRRANVSSKQSYFNEKSAGWF